VPLTIPNLDDRRFAELADEARALLVRFCPEWTDHNVSNPGIALMEMFAWLTETAMYQANQLPDEFWVELLPLLGRAPSGPLSTALRQALEGLEAVNRGVTASDLEHLALEAGQLETPRMARVRVVPDLERREGPDPEHPILLPMTLLIVVPDKPHENAPQPDRDAVRRIFHYVRQRRALTTRLHVIGPQYTLVNVTVTATRAPGSSLMAQQVAERIREFLHPVRGWRDGQGWPFGRQVHKSELYQLLENLDGLDHVDELNVGDPPPAVPTHGLVRLESLSVTLL
jgi:hypothetical protein